MSADLSRVKRAAAARRRAEREYRAALVDAYERLMEDAERQPWRVLADAASSSRQAVRQVVIRRL